ncbi:hypothetical protein BJY16_007648 [Actinoplanes octamycinicus]|uniref:Uncharacterized protein n=1 Tax=Actinoplanes octamycinicus TaxID=135948 RepID=A0A7W7H594_9ACTN|nr:hypothetical protein [Actinoplanes octamycinicus]MBB4744189.1 hypothetical protein [Actinoplanes octamycinicus]
MDWREFIDLVRQWAIANEKRISTKWPQKGGWEEWAKGEIFSYITDQRPSTDILREQRCWATKDADFVLNRSAADPSHKVVVEFKAQSYENYTNFLPGLVKDVQKLTKGLVPAYGQATLVVAGLYFTEHRTAIPGYFTTEALGNGEIGICYAVDVQ